MLLYYWIYLTRCEKEIKCSASLAFYLFSPTRLINLIKHEHSCKILYLCNRIWNCILQSHILAIFIFTFQIKVFHSNSFHRGSYMSAHVLLNLLNELGKRDKMRGLPSILPLFRNEFNKFNNTRARMLDTIYHMTNTLKSHFWHKNIIILSLSTQRCYGRRNVSRKSINH